MFKRPRRNRKNQNMRSLISENQLTVKDLIAPLFLVDDAKAQIDIPSMPGQCRLGIDNLLKKVEKLQSLGIPCISLFPACEDSTKDPLAGQGHNPDHFYQKAIRTIKQTFPEMLIMTDVAMDPYSSAGHDGYVCEETGEILNDKTLEILVEMSLCQAESGSDILGPSDMMDGRIGQIRKALEKAGHVNTSIMAYTAKYCSSFYGPFRDALDSAPKSGDKKTYQMDYANVEEAILEAKLDEEEGADILMVKPGLPYLDVLRALRGNTELPLAAYNVSGEYAMIKAAAANGWIDENAAIIESLTCFKRAGANMILTYFAEDAAKLIKS